MPATPVTPSSTPLSSTAAPGAPRRFTAARRVGSRPSRAMANTTREVTTSTALAVAAVVSRALPTTSRRPAAPPNAPAAAASGAAARPRLAAGRLPRATRVTSRYSPSTAARVARMALGRLRSG